MAVFFLPQVAHAAGDVEINAKNFPDDNFRNWLLKQDYGKDGVLSEEEIKDIKNLNVSRVRISSLQGIEHFTALTSMDCSYNRLTSLDVSKNTELTTLECSNYCLTSLNVSGCIALVGLFCTNTQLTALDVSGHTALVALSCFENYNLTTLNVSGCTALSSLTCAATQLTSLDASGCSALTSLDCICNQLTSLNVSGCTALTKLHCRDNQLTTLDVSECIALTELECYGNQIKGDSMDSFINSLPIKDRLYNLYAYSSLSSNEGNVCTKEQVQAAKERGWRVMYKRDDIWQEYEGSDDTSSVTNDIRTETYKDAPVYNLRGQRLTAPQKGINIIGGRKVIMK